MPARSSEQYTCPTEMDRGFLDRLPPSSIPVDGDDDLKLGTQHGIMKDAGLTEDDL